MVFQEAAANWNTFPGNRPDRPQVEDGSAAEQDGHDEQFEEGLCYFTFGVALASPSPHPFNNCADTTSKQQQQ